MQGKRIPLTQEELSRAQADLEAMRRQIVAQRETTAVESQDPTLSMEKNPGLRVADLEKLKDAGVSEEYLAELDRVWETEAPSLPKKNCDRCGRLLPISRIGCARIDHISLERPIMMCPECAASFDPKQPPAAFETWLGRPELVRNRIPQEIIIKGKRYALSGGCGRPPKPDPAIQNETCDAVEMLEGGHSYRAIADRHYPGLQGKESTIRKRVTRSRKQNPQP